MKYSSIAVYITLLTVGVLICCVGMLFETQSQYSAARTRKINSQLSTECTQYKLRYLFAQELLWYRLLAKTLKAHNHTKEQERVMQQLLRNQEELAQVLEAYACPQTRQSLAPVLHEHVNQARMYSQACCSKNNKLKREAQKAWLAATDKLAHILSCEGTHKNSLALHQALVDHKTLLEQELACETKKTVRVSTTQSEAFFEHINCLISQLLARTSLKN